MTRVSVVDEGLNTLYDEFVMPVNPIMDYNTRYLVLSNIHVDIYVHIFCRYSGITAESLQGVTRRVKDVQQDLLKFIDSNTILVGHSLENDLQALTVGVYYYYFFFFDV